MAAVATPYNKMSPKTDRPAHCTLMIKQTHLLYGRHVHELPILPLIVLALPVSLLIV